MEPGRAGIADPCRDAPAAALEALSREPVAPLREKEPGAEEEAALRALGYIE